MNRETKRRTVLGGVATIAVGGVGYYLGRESPVGRWLHPAESLAPDSGFAHVGGVVTDPRGTVMEVTVAVRDRPETGRRIELFADSETPVGRYFPPLRSFWRFTVDVSERALGTHRLRVGEAELAVTLERELPARYRGPRVRLTPVSTWRSDHIAHAVGFGHGDGTGTMELAFRQRTGGAPNPLDAVAFRDPTGRVVGRTSVPTGVWATTLALDPLRPFDTPGRLVGLWNDEVVDEIDLRYR